MTTSLPESIHEVADVVSLASDSFDVWWDLQAACNYDDYKSVLEEYQHFFQATINAHLVTLIVCSHALFDKRKGTQTIRSLLSRLERGASNAAVTSELQQTINELQGIWLKIKRVRDNVFAHRSETCQAESVFRAANLTPDEIRRFIFQSRQIVATIANETGMPSVFEEEISPTPHTQEIMQTLRREEGHPSICRASAQRGRYR